MSFNFVHFLFELQVLGLKQGFLTNWICTDKQTSKDVSKKICLAVVVRTLSQQVGCFGCGWLGVHTLFKFFFVKVFCNLASIVEVLCFKYKFFYFYVISRKIVHTDRPNYIAAKKIEWLGVGLL